MDKIDFEIVFDALSCIVPHEKKAFVIPMEAMTAKLAAKIAAIPDAVCLAKVAKVLECQPFGDYTRFLLRFGESDSFEALAKGVVAVDIEKPFLVCFTPRVGSYRDQDYVALDILAMTPCVKRHLEDDFEDDGPDPSDLAREYEDQRLAAEAHDAMT